MLEELRQQEGVTEQDVRDFEKSALLSKALSTVKAQAHAQEVIRKQNGHAFDHVKSKVARCLKVQKKVAKAKKKDTFQRTLQMQDPQASLNAALSVEPYGMRFGDKKSTWAKRTEEAIKPRVEEI